MGIPFVNVAVPALPNAPGAATDISGVTSVCLVIFPGAADDVVQFQQSFDGGTTWEPLFAFAGGPASAVVEADGTKMRAVRLAGTGGAYNAQVAGQQAGAPGHVSVNVGATPGLYGSLNISALSPNLSASLSATADDVVALEHTLDGTHWAPLAAITGGSTNTIVSGANTLRVNRYVAGNAGLFQAWGVPLK